MAHRLPASDRAGGVWICIHTNFGMGELDMSTETKEFPTLVVASSLTGFALCETNYSAMQEVTSWLCGFDVFTHELVHKPTKAKALAAGYAQFPKMPDRTEAEADWTAARDQALNEYGETVTVQRGDGIRTESPIDTLRDMRSDAEVIVVTP